MLRKLSSYNSTVYELTRKQIKTQYRDSSLGFLWTILNPLLNMLVMWVVFQSVLGIKDPYYPLYLLTGNVLFAALRASTTQALNSLVQNRNLLLRTRVELEVFPMSNVFASVVNFLFSLIALLPFMIWLSIKQGINLFTYRMAFIIPMLPAFLMFELGVGLFLATLFVFFRDLKHLYGVFLTLWQYLTPIFYTLNVLKNKQDSLAYKAIRLNPMYHFLNYFRDSVYRGATGFDVFGERIGAFIPNWTTFGVMYAFGFGALIIGFSFFVCLRNKIITRI